MCLELMLKLGEDAELAAVCSRQVRQQTPKRQG